jgi:hypothetical protein
MKAKSKRRRKQHVAILNELRGEVGRHIRPIARKYRHLFKSDRELKTHILTIVRTVLPPRPRRRGRPGDPIVTSALNLRAKLRREFTEETARQICQRVYVAVIPDYTNLPPMEQREARQRLQERMTWRRRKRRPRKNRAEISVS